MQLEKEKQIREQCMFPKGERPSDKIFNKIFFCTLLSAIIEIDDLRRKIHNVIFFFFSFSLFSPQNGEVWEKEGKYGVYFTKVPPTPSNNSYEFKYTYSRSFPQKHLYKSQEASKEKKNFNVFTKLRWFPQTNFTAEDSFVIFCYIRT